jgi:dimeric dUTPase (all-alpha-NTP-PPase superfamily)
MKDKLEEIFDLQFKMNMRVVDNYASVCQWKSPATSYDWAFKYGIAMNQELSEYFDSFPWKWWSKDNNIDLDNAKIEVVDMLHLLVSMAQVCGMSAQDLFDLYTKKNGVNHDRQNIG